MAGIDKIVNISGILAAAGKMGRVVEKAIATSVGKVAKFEEVAREMAKYIADSGSSVAEVGTTIGAAVQEVTHTTAGYGEEMMNTTREVEVGVPEWEQLANVAGFIQQEQARLMAGMASLSRKIEEAMSSSRLASQAFVELGIDVQGTESKLQVPNKVISELSVAFTEMEEHPIKTASSIKIFGEAGEQLLPILEKGKTKLKELAGEVLNSEDFLSSLANLSWEDFDNGLEQLASEAEKFGQWLGDTFASTLETVGGKIESVMGKVADWIEGNFSLEEAVEVVTDVISELFGEVDGVKEAMEKAATVATNVTKVFDGVNGVIESGVDFFKGLQGAALGAEEATIAYAAGAKIAATAKQTLNTVLTTGTEFYLGLTGATLSAGKASKAYEVGAKLSATSTRLLNAALNANPFVKIISLIIGIGTAVYLVIKNWDKIKEFFSQLWENVKTIFSTVWNWVKELFLNYTPYGLIIKHWDKISEFFNGIWDKVKNSFRATWEWVKGMLLDYTPVGLVVKHWDAISEFFSGIWDKVKNIFLTTWEWVKGMFLDYTPVGLVIKHWDAIGDFFSGIWENVKNIFTATWEWIKGMFLDYTPVGLVIKHWDAIGDFFSGIWENVKNIFTATWEWIKEMFLNYTPVGLIIKHWEAITNFFHTLWDNVKNIFVQTWDAISSLFSKINPVEWISQAWDKVGDFFSGLKDRFFGWGKDILQGLINGVTAFAKEAVDSIVNIGRNIAGKFKSLFGINSPSRLFMEYGVNITQGLAGGIHKGEGEAVEATRGLAVTATEKVKEALTGSMQSNSQSNSYATEMSNYIDGNNTEGGISLVYSPTVNISGSVTEQSQQDFLKLLRSHKDEIIDLIERHSENKTRLSFV